MLLLEIVKRIKEENDFYIEFDEYDSESIGTTCPYCDERIETEIFKYIKIFQCPNCKQAVEIDE